MIALGALAVQPSLALAFSLAPDGPASGNAGAMRIAYVVMAVLALLITLAVIGAVLRAARGGRRRDSPVRRTRGTAGAQARAAIVLSVAALVIFVAGVFLTESAREVEASESGAEPIMIQADGQQWLWRYEYPDQDGAESSDGYSAVAPFNYFELVVPVDTPIELEIGSIDVLHRWWVPALARQAEAVPGKTNTVNFLADQVGVFEGRSTEFSGPGYTTMRTRVRVVEQDEYEDWLSEQLTGIDEARDAVQEQVEAGTAPGVELEEGASE